MSNAHDQLAILLHLIDKLHRQHAAVKCLTELLCCSIQSTSKAVTLSSNQKEKDLHLLMAGFLQVNNKSVH